MKLNNKFAVVGLGSFGQSVATNLIENKCEVAVFDIDKEKVDSFMKNNSSCKYAVCVDTTTQDFVDSHSLKSFDLIILAIATNTESALFTATNLQSANISTDKIVIRAKDERQKKIYQKMDFENIFLPDQEIGEVVARKAIYDMNDGVKIIDDEFVATYVKVLNEKFFGKTLSDINFISDNKNFFIPYVKRNNKYFPPGLAPELQKGDKILIICRSKKINNFLEKFEQNS